MGERYDAFVSYSHSADGRVAPAVQRGLQQLARPLLGRRALRVFRDETGLSTNPHLWEAIAAALSVSEWFVLLASPSSASSEWVQREVATWLESKPLDRVLVVVTEGSLAFDSSGRVDRGVTDCLPPVLVDALVAEPRWLDLRWARSESQLDLRNGRFRAAIADLAAPIHGVAKDDLEGEDVRLQRRARRLAFGGATTVTMLSVVAVVAALIAVGQRNVADDQRSAAEEQRTLAEQRREEADQQRAEADQQRAAAEAASRAANARAVAAQADAVGETQPDLSLLLAVEAQRLDPSPETVGPLVAALTRVNGIERFLPDRLGPVVADRQGAFVYTVSDDQALVRYDTSSWEAEPVLPPAGAEPDRTVKGIVLSGDGTTLVVGRNGRVEFVDITAAPVLLGSWAPPVTPPRNFFGGAGVEVVSADRSGHLVAISDALAPLSIYRFASFDQAPSTVTGLPPVPTDAEFLPDGHVAVFTSADGVSGALSFVTIGGSAAVSVRTAPPPAGAPLPAYASLAWFPVGDPDTVAVFGADPFSAFDDVFFQVDEKSMEFLAQPWETATSVALSPDASRAAISLGDTLQVIALGDVIDAVGDISGLPQTVEEGGKAVRLAHRPAFLGQDRLLDPLYGDTGAAVLSLEFSSPLSQVVAAAGFGSVGMEPVDGGAGWATADDRGVVVVKANHPDEVLRSAALTGTPLAFDVAANGSVAAVVVGVPCGADELGPSGGASGPGDVPMCAFGLRTYRVADLSPLARASIDEHSLQFRGVYLPDVVSVDPDGKVVAVPLGDGSVERFDAASGATLGRSLAVPAERTCADCVQTLIWGEDGALQLIAPDGTLRDVEPLDDGQSLDTDIPPGDERCRADAACTFAYGPALDFLQGARPYVFWDPQAGPYWLTANDHGQVVELDPTSNQLTGTTFDGFRATQIRQVFTAFGGVLVVAVGADQVRLWMRQSRLPLGRAVPFATIDGFHFVGGSAQAWSVIDPLGRVGLYLSRPTGVASWSFDPNDWVEMACSIAGRSLTRDEWELYVGGEYSPACA